jgi:hypothetical protein
MPPAACSTAGGGAASERRDTGRCQTGGAVPAATLVGQLELGLGLFVVQPHAFGLLQPAVELGLDRLLAIAADQFDQLKLKQPAEQLDIVELVDLAQRLWLDRPLVLVGKLTPSRGRDGESEVTNPWHFRGGVLTEFSRASGSIRPCAFVGNARCTCTSSGARR